MASVSHPRISAITTYCIPSSSSSSSSLKLSVLSFSSSRITWPTTRRGNCRAMVQTQTGAPAAYAKEMERLSAKESLLLAENDVDAAAIAVVMLLQRPPKPLFAAAIAIEDCNLNHDEFKDAGGFEALVSGKTTEYQRIDVNERITGLERLNPTPRPTTSPFLEGRWNFEWFGPGTPGLFAAKFIFENFPSSLVNLSKMDVFIKDGNAKITANTTLLNSIESRIIISSKLSVEGPLRMTEEYVEAVLVSPTVIEDRVPEQLKGALGQAVNTLQQLPAPIRDAVANGLKVPLSGSYKRVFMISYLDEEILVIRDTSGMPEVLTRLDSAPSSLEETNPEYVS